MGGKKRQVGTETQCPRLPVSHLCSDSLARSIKQLDATFSFSGNFPVMLVSPNPVICPKQTRRQRKKKKKKKKLSKMRSTQSTIRINLVRFLVIIHYFLLLLLFTPISPDAALVQTSTWLKYKKRGPCPFISEKKSLERMR